jgi:hypothetical protein
LRRKAWRIQGAGATMYRIALRGCAGNICNPNDGTGDHVSTC